MEKSQKQLFSMPLLKQKGIPLALFPFFLWLVAKAWFLLRAY